MKMDEELKKLLDEYLKDNPDVHKVIFGVEREDGSGMSITVTQPKSKESEELRERRIKALTRIAEKR